MYFSTKALVAALAAASICEASFQNAGQLAPQVVRVPANGQNSNANNNGNSNNKGVNVTDNKGGNNAGAQVQGAQGGVSTAKGNVALGSSQAAGSLKPLPGLQTAPAGALKPLPGLASSNANVAAGTTAAAAVAIATASAALKPPPGVSSVCSHSSPQIHKSMLMAT